MKINVVELIQSLQSILEAEHPNKVKLIKDFQNEVWNGESVQDEALNEILLEFAYDLDFYEPNKQWRKESHSYYADDRLEREIKSAIQKIQKQTADGRNIGRQGK